MILENEDAFVKARSREPIELICEFCGGKYTLPKNAIQSKISKQPFGPRFCSKLCAKEFSKTTALRRTHPCFGCGKETNNSKFCSRICSGKYQNRNTKKLELHVFCLNCGNQTYNKKFCNNTCCWEYKNRLTLEKWKKGEDNGTTGFGEIKKVVRKYILDKFNHACVECGWSKINPKSGKVPVQIEHKDGNFLNNKEENLTVLCPNCHSLTSTYMALNRGNGRDLKGSRRKNQKVGVF